MSPLPLSRRRASSSLLLAVWRVAVALLLLASTVLWLGSAILWVRSYWAADSLRWSAQVKETRMTRDVTIHSARGGVGIFSDEYAGFHAAMPGNPAYRSEPATSYPAVPGQTGSSPGFLGFSAFSRSSMEQVRAASRDAITSIWYRHHSAGVILPWWAVLLAATPLPAIAIVKRRRRRLKLQAEAS